MKKKIIYGFLFFLLYVLSSGPVLSLVKHQYLPEFFVYAYVPLVYLGLICRPIGVALLYYAFLCGAG